jgi:hypothetical protein
VALRDERIYAAWKEGLTLQQLAERHELTPQRIGQIVAARHPELDEDVDRGVHRGRLDNLAAQVQEVIGAPGWKLTPRGDIAVDDDGTPVVDVMAKIQAMELQLKVYAEMRRMDARDRQVERRIQVEHSVAHQAFLEDIARRRAEQDVERRRLEDLARRAGVVQGEVLAELPAGNEPG